MPGLLRRVKTTLSIGAHRRIAGLLDGEYASVFHGRSLEFDDLRPYVPGDELKDIDWKATARLGDLMTRRFVARRQHTVVLVVDDGRAMAARAAGGESKREVAVLAAGVLGYLAHRHGDLVGLLARDRYHPASGGEAHLERLLQTAHDAIRLDAPAGDLTAPLARAARLLGRGRILVVVSDDCPLGEAELALVRRLAVRHELLWVTIADADLMAAELVPAGVRDVESSLALPAFVRDGPALRAEFAAATAAAAKRTSDALERLGVASARVGSSEAVIPALLRLLEEHRRARR
ncbi:DUF58 domain-containing protein [Galbitalea sp. SE-J8]|uniref:DUF58 domain-containing protein n=1 Tax=Galbitalea sp. SE-J8 TaxID=3054952 RepID=UPI00259C969A|nr:DUF58 domain-containing protein [Galbitalea sp. SE-J8]MDM4763498.1 DUF58 domain-containing protein [Galbitalea sp. SE-J8]